MSGKKGKIMRVTQKILFGNFMRDVSQNRSKMGRIQSDLSSGRSVRVPSHDPVSFQRSRIIDENIRKEEQYQSNLSSGLQQARVAQESLDNAIDSLIDLKELVVRGSSDTSGTVTRDQLADQVSGIYVTVVDALNEKYGERYLFAGTNSGEQPFVLQDPDPMDPSAAPVVDNRSNDDPLQILAADGIYLQTGVTGVSITSTEAGDLFDVIRNVEDALRADDQEAINSLLEDVDEVINHVTHNTAELGNYINRMEFMNERYESSRIIQESNISELVDTDYARAFSDLQRTEIAFEAALAVHSSMLNNSLLDYL